MIRFYWIAEGELAGCSRPGGRLRRASTLEADLTALTERGIGALLTLTARPLPADALRRYGLTALHLPVPDFHPPTTEQFLRALRFIDERRADGAAVAVHCQGGQGRTGSVLAAWLIRAGDEPELALRRVRGVCPGAVEVKSQEDALRRLARDKPWLA